MRTQHESTTHPYTADAFEAPSVVTGPVVLALVDGEADDSSIRAARDIADRCGAALEAVVPLEPLAVYALGVDAGISPELEAARRADAERTSRTRLANVLGAHPWRSDVRLGNATRVTARAAEERGATLVVTGAGRHGLTERLLGGELALQVLRLGDRPVLAVVPGWEGLPRRVVVGMDFSAASVRAARLAARMLGESATLSLVHVNPPVESTALLGEGWRVQMSREVGDRFARVRTILEGELPKDAHLALVERDGLVVDEVLAVARETEADLIAIGTQGRSFLERLFIGSVATGVLRRATRAVLAAPPPAAAERAWTELRMRGAATIDDATEWGAVLDAFTRRHAGRRSWIEVDDPSSGAQLQQRGLTFAGATYDRHDHRVVLSFLDPAAPTRHLARDIARVGWIALRGGATPAEEVLCLAHGRGQTLLGFADA